MAKRRLRKSLRKPLMIFTVLVVVGIIFLVLNLFVFNNIKFFGVKSANKDAKTYKTKTCLAFYPNSKKGKEVVKDLCSSAKEDSIFDYSLIPYGDYYLVEYGSNVHYYVDHKYSPLEVTSISEEGKQILADYLKYDMKKAEIDEAYTLSFNEKTKSDNLNIDDCTYEVEGEYLYVYYPDFDFTSKVPLKYIQNAAGINLGYENELYIKPKYISPNRKTISFTFDDGPSILSTNRIIDALYENDAVGTFFILGNRLGPQTVLNIKDSINKGNEYGSHTQSHPYLVLLSDKEVYEEIVSPANDLKDGYHTGSEYDFDGLGYSMNLYRAPYGEHNSSVDAVSPFMTIEWDVDSKDWYYRDADLIKENIYDFENKNPGGLDGCIVLFHDIYDSTADAVEELVPELIEKGYQFVTVSELLDILDVDKTKAYYPW